MHKPKAKDPQLTMFARQRPPEIRAFDLMPGEILIDNFAGGGGVSEGVREGVGRPVNIAINHDPEAVAVYAANNPGTKVFCESLLTVDPREVCQGRRPGYVWFAPDCTHHSKAKGSKPRDSKIRGLMEVVITWLKTVRPRIISVENVEEVMDWGPLDDEGYPIPEFKGDNFRAWLGAISDAGYKYEYRTLVAADYGAPTTRKRFFLIARRDGKPIVWGDATHGRDRPEPWRPASDIISWDTPCPSIFTPGRNLVEPTMRRIALGVMRYVIANPRPFLIKYHGSPRFRGQSIDEPLRTVDSSNRFGLVEPFIVRTGHYSTKTGQGLERMKGGAGLFRGQTLDKPLATVCATNDKNLVVPFLTRYFGNPSRTDGKGGVVVGRDLREPMPTVTGRDHNGIAAAYLMKYYGTGVGSSLDAPAPTVTGQGQHLAQVQAFLLKYYGNRGLQGIDDPLHTVTAKARFGLVTVYGVDYQIVDIGMRMLKPRELFNAQDFPRDYIIDPEYCGKSLTQEAQIRIAGNAVPRCLPRMITRAQAVAA